MSNIAVHADAELLIRTVARAFYDDDAVCLIDVLIHDKFLRDDDMMSRLSLPAKQLRRTLQFLQEEHLVKFELVDDLQEGGSQATKYWYIDYNHAVNAIRLRIYLLGKKLEEAELRARNSSIYLCPGYATKACNGRYTEIEAQLVVDQETGRFLCQECYKAHIANPDPPPKISYTLDIVDSSKALKQASMNLRRVKDQLSTKMIGKQQLRTGIYETLKKVRGSGASSQAIMEPLSSNLPSENRAVNLGTKRVAGTGRTAHIQEKKRQTLGVITEDGKSQKHLGRSTEDDLIFLKNAIGQQIAFEIEKGAGARANLLVNRNDKDKADDLAHVTERWTKCLDAAAVRIGVEPDHIMQIKRRREEKAVCESEYKKHMVELPFLINNIGLVEIEEENGTSRIHYHNIWAQRVEEATQYVVEPEVEAFERMSEEEKRVAFQTFYKKELQRQRSIIFPMHINGMRNGTDENMIAWIDGDI